MLPSPRAAFSGYASVPVFADSSLLGNQLSGEHGAGLPACLPAGSVYQAGQDNVTLQRRPCRHSGLGVLCQKILLHLMECGAPHVHYKQMWTLEWTSRHSYIIFLQTDTP